MNWPRNWIHSETNKNQRQNTNDSLFPFSNWSHSLTPKQFTFLFYANFQCLLQVSFSPRRFSLILLFATFLFMAVPILFIFNSNLSLELFSHWDRSHSCSFQHVTERQLFRYHSGIFEAPSFHLLVATTRYFGFRTSNRNSRPQRDPIFDPFI